MQTGMQDGVQATIGPRLFGPGLLLGAGLGAFLDGIVLHQLLRWHHLLSAVPGVSLRANLIADGVFHAGAWLAVLAGVLWLWHRSPRADATGSWTALVAAMIAGWGLFNVVEGLLDHYILKLHHVRPGPNQAIYDMAFLICGALLAIGGLAWYRRTTSAARRCSSPETVPRSGHH